MPPNSRNLVRGISNAQIVSERDTAIFPAVLKPLLIGAIRRKQVGVPLHGDARSFQRSGKTLSQVAIREENMAQAARS
jgi:hypothetical protein